MFRNNSDISRLPYTLAFNASNSFEEVVLDTLRVQLGPVAHKNKVEVLGREGRCEVPAVPLQPRR